MKQVIVMRNDLNMHKGKMIVQGAHASMMFIVQAAFKGESVDLGQWLSYGGMTKICVRVDSEADLEAIELKARQAGLIVHLITDAGRTEFGGVPTKTCLAIGPNDSEAIDAITGGLKLL